WGAAKMDEWYGNAARRRAVVDVADAMYRAGAGDVSALPNVARLAVDRSHGAPIRASAAEFIGQLLAKARTAGSATVNSLIAAADDPEPIVRITAVRSLAVVPADDTRVSSVLAAHLTDSSRVVRAAAAEGLLDRGIARLDGPVGEALAHAQDEL